MKDRGRYTIELERFSFDLETKTGEPFANRFSEVLIGSANIQ